jgi:uncharacterized protein with PIN domain
VPGAGPGSGALSHGLNEAVEPFAREKYGAGRYRLNLGDCLSYGAAHQSQARLVYVGEDFARTDVNDHR